MPVCAAVRFKLPVYTVTDSEPESAIAVPRISSWSGYPTRIVTVDRGTGSYMNELAYLLHCFYVV